MKKLKVCLKTILGIINRNEKIICNHSKNSYLLKIGSSNMLYLYKMRKEVSCLKNSNNLFKDGEVVSIQKTGELVTISKCQYVKHMKKYSYTVSEHPSTFYFEEELQRPQEV